MKLHERGLAMSKILIVEDEESIADIEKDYLDMRLRYVMMEQVALRLHCMRILICVSLILCFPELMVSRYASR